MPFRIQLSKENFKFSCSHFTILREDHAERLHGHNYYVSVELGVSDLDPRLGMAFDFNRVKPFIKTIVGAWDERVLLPENSPFLRVERKGEAIQVAFLEKRYSFPAVDSLILPVANITSEELARCLAKEFISLLGEDKELRSRLTSLTVAIEETRGQAAIYEQAL